MISLGEHVLNLGMDTREMLGRCHLDTMQKSAKETAQLSVSSSYNDMKLESHEFWLVRRWLLFRERVDPDSDHSVECQVGIGI